MSGGCTPDPVGKLAAGLRGKAANFLWGPPPHWRHRGFGGSRPALFGDCGPHRASGLAAVGKRPLDRGGITTSQGRSGPDGPPRPERAAQLLHELWDPPGSQVVEPGSRRVPSRECAEFRFLAKLSEVSCSNDFGGSGHFLVCPIEVVGTSKPLARNCYRSTGGRRTPSQNWSGGRGHMSVRGSSVQSVKPLVKSIINPALADHVPREGARFKDEFVRRAG